VVGGLHFITGPGYSGPIPLFVNGYLIDLLLPFSMCLLLGIQKTRALQLKPVRFALVFGVGFLVETLQYLGVSIFGNTFDPLDYLMYATGTAGAFAFEWAVLSRIRPRIP
jgi:hypothetical protein